jgi:hypothetical protein
MNSRRVLFFLAAVASTPIACSSSNAGSPTPDGGSDAAHDAATTPDAGNTDAAGAPETVFWNAFWAGDMAAGIADIPALQTAIKTTPDDGYDNLLVGMDALWQLAESGRDPQNAQKVGETYGPMAAEYLGTAHGINSSDPFTTALDGFLVWNEGVTTNSSTLEQQGVQLVQEAYGQSPAIGWFIQTIMAGNAPVSSSLMTTAVTNGWAYYAACSGTKLSDSDPDYSTFFAAFVKQANASGSGLCVKQLVAPYWLEGNLLYFGDLLVKSGNVAGATAAYTAATQLDNYSTWPHKDVVESRLASATDGGAGADAGMTLAQRAASYQGPESTWPAFAAEPFVCGTCHNKTAQ